MNARSLSLALAALICLAGSLNAAQVILNEYNAVSSSRYLDGNDYSDAVDAEDPYFGTFPDMPNGRIQGNGGNWIELVVVEDHVDMRGWDLRWTEAPSDEGTITLSSADTWSDLRSGTIITIGELETIPVDTTIDAGERNFTVAADSSDGTFEATIDLSTDISYDPAGGDWWIHISTLDELDSPTPLATTVTNVVDDTPGNFSVGNDDWQLTILDQADAVVFGPVGEGVGDLGGVGSQEVAKLEENPSSSITPASAYNDGTSSTFGAPNVWSAGTTTQDFSALRAVIDAQPTMLQAGDANQDLRFDQLDIIAVQVAAKYLTGEAATWGEGDWNGAPGGSVGNPPLGNGRFDQLDIVAAQQNALYLQGDYSALHGEGDMGDGQASIVYDANTGEIAVDAPVGVELTSVNVESASGIFTGDPALNLGGDFDNDNDTNIFKATFGTSFGSISFGNVAPTALDEQFLIDDLSVVGSLAGGGGLGDVDLVYIPVPEPTAFVLLVLGIAGLAVKTRKK